LQFGGNWQSPSFTIHPSPCAQRIRLENSVEPVLLFFLHSIAKDEIGKRVVQRNTSANPPQLRLWVS
jgi:hypothetical protein